MFLPHLSSGGEPTRRVHSEAADVVSVVQVERLPMVGGVVAHARPARVVYNLPNHERKEERKKRKWNGGARERWLAQQR